MKAKICLFIALLFAVSVLFPVPALAAGQQVQATVAEPDITARGAVLMEVTTGRILWQSNARAAYPMASVTKVMTAIVALEHAKLDEVVTVDPKACGIEGSSLYLQAGEKLTLEQLLYGLMLRSGNDAAMAIAIYVAGSEEAFVQMMNDTARRIGTVNTHFTNPHGLQDEDHYTTAADMALICAYGLKNDDFARIVATQSQTIPGVTYQRVLKNKNRLLWEYEGCTGIKIGYTRAAGRCLAASASRDGMQLVAVVLGCGDMFGACAQLLDYGFSRYRMTLAAQKGETVGSRQVSKGLDDQVSLVAARDVWIPMLRDGSEKLWLSVEEAEPAMAPIVTGVRGGTGVATLDDLSVEFPLMYGGDVPLSTLWRRLRSHWEKWYNDAISKKSEDTLCVYSGIWPSAESLPGASVRKSSLRNVSA